MSSPRLDPLSLQAPDPILLVDAAGGVLDGNHAAAAALARGREELRGSSLRELGDPRRDGRFTARYGRPDGTHASFEVHARPVDVDGERAILCVLRELEPRRAEDVYALSFRRCPVSIAVVDLADNKYVDVNDVFLSLMNLTREQVIGKTFIDVGIHISHEDTLKIGRAVAYEDPRPVEYSMVRPDGGVTHCLQTLEYLDFDGKRCVVAYMLDITEHKRLEGELRQAQKLEAIGRLAGGVAHDFNNVLTAILGYSELMRLSSDEASLRRHADSVRRVALRATSLTGQLLAFSRKQVLQPRVIDVGARLAGLTGILQRIIGEDIELVTELPDEPACVRGDLAQLEQVVLNLAVNARDAMIGGGRLVLRVALDGDVVRLEVSDSGSGMDEATRAHLFEPFFTTKPEGRGTGLGLSTVYGIVTQSGGQIEVESATGRGTTFRVLLPRVAGPATPDGPPLQTQPARGKESILLVDDDPDVRSFVEEALATLGYEVRVACDGQGALRMATDDDRAIHLLISDVVMPRMSGPELSERIRFLRPQIRTLYITGYPGNALAERDLARPDMHLVRKPFSVTELAHHVRAALDAQS
jgi:PAS domain S-box-containing protein